MPNTTAEKIVEQMGGMKRLKVMVGAKNFVQSNNAVSFHFTHGHRNVNAVKVTLEAHDLYTMDFFTASRAEAIMIDSRYDITAENLKATFESVTGFFLTL